MDYQGRRDSDATKRVLKSSLELAESRGLVPAPKPKGRELPPDLGTCRQCHNVFFAFWKTGHKRETIESRILEGSAETICESCTSSGKRKKGKDSRARLVDCRRPRSFPTN